MSDSASDSDDNSSSGSEDGIDVDVSALMSLEAPVDGIPHAYDKHIEVITI